MLKITALKQGVSGCSHLFGLSANHGPDLCLPDKRWLTYFNGLSRSNSQKLTDNTCRYRMELRCRQCIV